MCQWYDMPTVRDQTLSSTRCSDGRRQLWRYKHSPGSVPDVVQAMQCWCIERKVSWCLGTNCLVSTHLQWLLLTFRFIRPSFPGNTPKKKGNCAEYNTNPQITQVSDFVSICYYLQMFLYTRVYIQFNKKLINLVRLQ